MSESPLQRPSIEGFRSQLNNEAVLPWTVDVTRDNEVIKFQQHDGAHSIAKYTVALNTALEFSVFALNWPVPDDHAIYNERKRRVCDLEDCKTSLKSVEDSKICDSAPQDFVTQSVVQGAFREKNVRRTPAWRLHGMHPWSVVVDPTSDYSNFPDSTLSINQLYFTRVKKKLTI